MVALAQSHIFNLQPYVPGKTFRATQKEFGITDLVKLASNENCLGPSPKAIKALSKGLENIHLYPLEHRSDVKKELCKYLRHPKLSKNNIVLGNGSNELINTIVRAFIARDEVLLNAWPSFLMYRIAARALNAPEAIVPLDSQYGYDLEAMCARAKGPDSKNIKVVFVANPNNPTGRHLDKKTVAKFLRSIPEHVVVVLDEAYAEYVTNKNYQTALDWVFKRPRTVVLRTFSKVFGLAGLRIGAAICGSEIANILHRIREPFNVNSLAQIAAVAALKDQKHIEHSVKNNSVELTKVSLDLQNIGFKTTDSSANFLLTHLVKGMPETKEVVVQLLKRGVIVRGLFNYDLPRSLRITIGTPEQNHRLISALKEILAT